MLLTLHCVGGKVCCDVAYSALCGCEGRVVMLHTLHCVGGKCVVMLHILHCVG